MKTGLAGFLTLGLVACGGSVSGGSSQPADPQRAPDTDAQRERLHAQILGEHHIADAGGSVSFEAAPSASSGVTYTWSFGDGAAATGQSVRHTYPGTGCYIASLRVSSDNGERDETSVRVYAPADIDATIDPLPQDHGFIGRTAGEDYGTVAVSGLIASPGWQQVVVDTFANGTTLSSSAFDLCATRPEGFMVNVRLPVTLQSYDVVVSARVGERTETLARVTDLAAGDVFVIQGQSNAVATDIQGFLQATHPFVRTLGTAATDEATSTADDTWYLANGNVSATTASVGQWAMRMAARLADEHQVPLAVFNGAHSGQPISVFQRDELFHANPTTNYGRLLRRLQVAGLDAHVRAVFYFQGESDAANAGGHRDGLAALYGAWRDDFPELERVYITQVRPGCGDPSLELRDAQRTLGGALAKVSTMSTSAMDAHDGCHYTYDGGYKLLGDAYANLAGRDLYGSGDTDVEAIDVEGAMYVASNNTIRVQTRSDATSFTLEPGISGYFLVPGTSSYVQSASMEGSVLVLQLSPGSGAPTGIYYNAHQGVGPTLLNARGVGMLAFRLPL